MCPRQIKERITEGRFPRKEFEEDSLAVSQGSLSIVGDPGSDCDPSSPARAERRQINGGNKDEDPSER